MSNFWDNSIGGIATTSGKLAINYDDVVAPGTFGPDFIDNEWDTLHLAGLRIPGLCKVTFDQERRVQHKKQNGSDGATPTFRGLDPAKGSIEILLWTDGQYKAWKFVYPAIFPLPNKDIDNLAAVQIGYPTTKDAGISSIIITNMPSLDESGTHGCKKITMKWVQYLPVKTKSQTKTVVGAVAVTKFFQAQPKVAGKNTPAKPSTTDTGPNPAPTPAQGTF